MATSCTLRVSHKDKERMMKECKELFLKSHPKLKEINLSQRFMFNQLVNYYLKI